MGRGLRRRTSLRCFCGACACYGGLITPADIAAGSRGPCEGVGGVGWWKGGYLEAAGQVRVTCRLFWWKWHGKKRAEMTKKSISAPMVFRTTTGNPAYLDPGQHQMTMKQSCSLALERCFHFDLILILTGMELLSYGGAFAHQFTFISRKIWCDFTRKLKFF